MLAQRLHQHIADILSIQLNQPVQDVFVKSIGGGSINQTYQLRLSNQQQFFCKMNKAAAFPQMFLKEKRGLQILNYSGVIQVPNVVAYSVFENQQILMLEWIESGSKDKSFFKLFGQQLAALHHNTHAHFGLDDDNYMGSIPQSNTQHTDWCFFFIQQRLAPLLKKCSDRHLLTSQDASLFEVLYTKLPRIFDGEQKPALLHGDLWSGNYMCNGKGQPVLIDPAVYYGHPAIDLGLTTLFGGFDTSFYESYAYHQPLPNNYQQQWAVCNLYPLLIHLLLFGSGYLNSIRQTLKAYA